MPDGEETAKSQQNALTIARSPNMLAFATIVSAGLFFMGPVIPPLGFMVALMSPAPIAYLAYKNGWKEAALAVVLAAVAPGLALGWASGLEYVLTFGLGGLVTGAGLRLNWGPEKTVGLYALPAVLGFVGFVLIGAHKAGVGPAEYISQMAGEWSEPLKQALSGKDMPPEVALEVKTTIEGTQKFIRELAFGISAGFSILLGAFNAAFIRRILKDRGEPLEDWGGWKVPETWIWLLIVAGAMTAMGTGNVSIVGKNLLIPSVVVYFLQGLVIGYSVLMAYNVTRFFRALIYALVVLNLQFTLPLLSLMGAFDQWLDVRGRFKPKPAEQ